MYNSRYLRESFMKKMRLTIGIALVAALSVGCTSTTVKYINPTADFSYITKVALLPFNNMSSDNYAGEKIRSILTVQLLAKKKFDLVEQGEARKVVSQVLRAQGVQEGDSVRYDTDAIKLIGEKLGVQAVIIGGVNAFPGQGTASVASISLKMIDTSSGVVLWQVITTAKGSNPLKTFLGLKDSTPLEVAFKVSKKALRSLK